MIYSNFLNLWMLPCNYNASVRVVAQRSLRMPKSFVVDRVNITASLLDKCVHLIITMYFLLIFVDTMIRC